MSQTSQSFVDQLEAAATQAVIGTKKAAKALAPSDIKTSQQDKLADMGTYKRRQKKMEKGLLNQEVEKIATQNEFLKKIGILERANILSKKMTFKEKANMFYRLKKLMDYREMGRLFKVLFAQKKGRKFSLGF